ncbi:MAG: L-rhamnose mutarotase [Candidatus Latescibacterota bacterium]|nr:L-rhamnose mutarotase [Candidatus Latescibacterota bacterium]
MKVYGLTLQLRDDPEIIENYKEFHRNPWPEPLHGLTAVGITEMRIFLLGTRMFMYMTACDDFEPEVDFPRYVKENPKAAEWDELMRTFQQRVPEAAEGEWWAMMEKVFDLDDHV